MSTTPTTIDDTKYQHWLGDETRAGRMWEDVGVGICPRTERLSVPGGWLYRTTTLDGGVAMTFVPKRWWMR